jgi:hypothetical protein
MEKDGGMILPGENRRTRRKVCPSATFSTTNPTWIDPGLRGERPATNRLSHGTVSMMMMIIIIIINRPDTIVKNKKDKTCLLIDVAVSSDRNII